MIFESVRNSEIIQTVKLNEKSSKRDTSCVLACKKAYEYLKLSIITSPKAQKLANHHQESDHKSTQPEADHKDNVKLPSKHLIPNPFETKKLCYTHHH